MNVTKINIRNILGIDELEIHPGRFTQITGRNGSGKTSVLEAIKATLKGGHDATLLRNGAESGEVVLVLDNGDEIRKVVTPEKSELKVRKDGKLVRNAASILDELRDIVSVNPVEFIMADAKRRMEILLEALSFELTSEQLSEAAGFPVSAGSNALESIGNARKSLYDERTGLNRAEREKRATLNQLSESIPPSVDADPDAEIARLTEEVDTLQHQLSESLQVTLTDEAKACTEVDEWRAKEIERINAEADAKKAATRATQTQLADEARAKYSPEIDSKRARLAELGQIVKSQAAFQQQKAIIEQMEAEVEQLSAKARSATEAIERLDSLKESLLQNTPFKGLVIRDGEIYIDGVAFDRVNSSDQVRFVLQLAAQRAGDLKLVCVDGLELIDSERYTRFIDAAKKMDLQFFVTRVSSEEFTVTTE